MDTIQLRNFKPGDEPIVLDLYRAADEVDRAERGMTADELNRWLTGHEIHPETDFFIAEENGVAVGFIGMDVLPDPETGPRAFCGGVVHPAHRRRGTGTRLMRAVEARAREVAGGPPGHPAGSLTTFCRSFQADHVALYESRGMSPTRYFISMQRALRDDLTEIAAPDGFVIRTYRDEDDEALRDAHNDAFRDHWDHTPLSPELWRDELRGVSYFRPDLWFVAWAGGEIAGFALNKVDPHYIERVGRPEGVVDEVGVRRPWRKRGLATALLARSLRALREAGMDHALLGVDADSPTNAVRLYERVRFKEIRRNVVYRKALR